MGKGTWLPSHLRGPSAYLNLLPIDSMNSLYVSGFRDASEEEPGPGSGSLRITASSLSRVSCSARASSSATSASEGGSGARDEEATGVVDMLR